MVFKHNNIVSKRDIKVWVSDPNRANLPTNKFCRFGPKEVVRAKGFEILTDADNDTVTTITCELPRFLNESSVNVEVLLKRDGFSESFTDVNLVSLVELPRVTGSYN